MIYMSGYNSQFDIKKEILPDLTIKPIVALEIEEKEDPTLDEPASPLPPTEEEDDDIFIGQKKDVIQTVSAEDLTEEPIRGKDKKQRKKREFTPAMREGLKKAREKKMSKHKEKKLLELQKLKESAIEEYKCQVRERNKHNPPSQKAKVLEAPVLAKQPSFDEFCSIMDRYEEYKSKKSVKVHIKETLPHPNKIVRRGLPRPPATSGVFQQAPSLLQVRKPTYNKWAF